MPQRVQMVRVALWVYLPMLAAGFFTQAPGTLFVDDLLPLLWWVGAALGIGALAVWASRWVSQHTGWGRALRDEFRGVLGDLDSRQILVLALLSSFGEELLFRGVLHPRLGLLATALIFGLFHFPYRRALLPWTLFAVGIGLILGLLTDYSGSLWPAILLHFFINYFNLHDLVRQRGEEA